jgi:hypothetical protein
MNEKRRVKDARDSIKELVKIIEHYRTCILPIARQVEPSLEADGVNLSDFMV